MAIYIFAEDFKKAALVTVCHLQGSVQNQKISMPRSFLVRGRPQANFVPVDKSAAPAQTKTMPGERKKHLQHSSTETNLLSVSLFFKKISRVVRTEVRI